MSHLAAGWLALHFAAEIVILIAGATIAIIKFAAAGRIDDPIGKLILRLLGCCTLSFAVKAIVISVTTWAETWRLLIIMEGVTAVFLAAACTLLVRLVAAWRRQA